MAANRLRAAALVSTLAGSLALAGACEKHRVLELTFGENASGLNGFACVNASQTPLLLRANSGGIIDAALVVDFIKFKADPGCRASQMVSYCNDAAGNCDVLPAKRVCVPLPAGPFPTPIQLAGIPGLLQQNVGPVLDGEVLASDAPDDLVVVRVMGMADRTWCTTHPQGTALDPNLEIGAAYSCPVHLDSAPNPLYLGFDSLTNQCEAEVKFVGQSSYSP